MRPFYRNIISRRAGLILILLALGVNGPARAQTNEAPRNIQIAVEARQAGYESRDGIESRSKSSQTQFIVVTEGLEGRIFVGEKLPYVSYYRDYMRQEGYLTGEVTFLDVGTSLIVTARVYGSEIEVTLTPEISYETQDGRRSIAIRKMTTSVRVQDGQSVEIGGNVSTSDFDNNFYRSRSGQALQFVLTPKIR